MADDNTTELKIHIVSEADNKGFQQTADASKKLKVDTSDLSDETKRALGLMPQLSAATVKSGEAAAEASISHREWRRVLSDIGNTVAPGAGAAMGEMSMGALGPALALVGAYELLKKNLEDVSDAEDAFAEIAAQPQTGGIKAIETAWKDATTAQAQYEAAMRTAGDDNDPVATRIKNIKAIAEATIESSKQIVEAYGKQEVAYLRANRGTPEQIAAAESRTQSQLDSLAEQLAASQGIDALKLEQSKRQAQADDLAKSERDANAAKQAADAKYNTDQGKLDAAQNVLSPGTKDNADLITRRDAAQAAIDAANEIPDTEQVAGEAAILDNRAAKQTAVNEAQAQLDQINREIANDNKEIDQLRQTKVQREADKDAADKAATEASAASEINQKRLRQLPGEIAQDQAVQSAKDVGTQGIELLNTHLENTNITLGQALVATNKTAQQTTNIVKDILDHTLTLQQVQAQLQAQLNAQRAQIANMSFNGH